jgi:hypothetical protein
LVGLAASIVIAVVTFRPSADETLIAEVQPNPEVVEADPLVTPDIVPEGPEAVQPEMIAAVEPAPGPVSPSPIEKDPIVDPAPVTPPIEAIATSPDPAMDSVKPPPAVNMIGNPVMVVEVRLTKAGHQSGAVRQAMKLAELDPTSEQKITRKIVAVAKQAMKPLPDGEKVSVLYLQASATKLDQFYLELNDDLLGIASIRLAIAMDAAIQGAVKGIRADARMVQLNEASLKLFGDSDVVDEFAQQLSQLQFAPNNRDAVNMPVPFRLNDQKAVNKDMGPDVPGQFLVLVRWKP